MTCRQAFEKLSGIISGNLRPYVKQVAEKLDETLGDSIIAAIGRKDNGRDDQPTLVLTIRKSGSHEERFEIEFPSDNVRDVYLFWRYRKLEELTDDEKSPPSPRTPGGNKWSPSSGYTRRTQNTLTLDQLLLYLKGSSELLEEISMKERPGEYFTGFDLFG